MWIKAYQGGFLGRSVSQGVSYKRNHRSYLKGQLVFLRSCRRLKRWPIASRAIKHDGSVYIPCIDVET